MCCKKKKRAVSSSSDTRLSELERLVVAIRAAGPDTAPKEKGCCYNATGACCDHCMKCAGRACERTLCFVLGILVFFAIVLAVTLGLNDILKEVESKVSSVVAPSSNATTTAAPLLALLG